MITCPFCNSKTYQKELSYKSYCKFCSNNLNIAVWWIGNSGIVEFSTKYKDVAEYYMADQELRLADGTKLEIPLDKLIDKMKTILLLS